MKPCDWLCVFELHLGSCCPHSSLVSRSSVLMKQQEPSNNKLFSEKRCLTAGAGVSVCWLFWVSGREEESSGSLIKSCGRQQGMRRRRRAGSITSFPTSLLLGLSQQVSSGIGRLSVSLIVHRRDRTHCSANKQKSM